MFNNITRGQDAHQGVDPTTGLGSPKAPGLVALLSGVRTVVTPNVHSHQKVKVRVAHPHGKVYSQRAEFMHEEMTGFARLYLQK